MSKTVSDQVVERLHAWGVQMKHYARALLHGDPQAVELVKATAREWWDGFRTRK